jgi:SecD/SecF fusion protein
MAAMRTLRFELVLLVALAWACCGCSTYVDQNDGPPDFKSAALIYEVAPYVEESTIDLKILAEALDRRLNPTGARRIAVTPEGTRQIKIEVGECTAERLQLIKRMVSTAGKLEFRMLANEKEHWKFIDDARELMGNDLRMDDEIVARWVTADWRVVELASDREEAHREIIELALATNDDEVARHGQTQAIWLTLELESIPEDLREGLATRKLAGGENQVLALTNASRDSGGHVLRVDQLNTLQILTIQDEFNVTGANLKSAVTNIDDHGRLAIGFEFNKPGAESFAKLTTKYAPNLIGFHRQLGIVLDDVLLSAPTLNEPITGGFGQISGNFTEEEVDFIVAVLNAGSLPVRLERQPVSEMVVEIDVAQDEPGKPEKVTSP